MNYNYTKINHAQVKQYSSYNDTDKSMDDAIEDAIDFLNKPTSFRDFDEGLNELLHRTGHAKNLTTLEEKAEYLFSKLQAIHSETEKDTVFSWFLGKHRPKIEAGSRKRMFEICFALQLSFKDTVWFFHHVYYDRAFNYHTIEEAVFYYAFLHQLSYEDSLRIISEITNAPYTPASSISEKNYTIFIKDSIEKFDSENELKHFLISNRENFQSWNKHALTEIQNILTTLIASPKGKEEIDSLKKRLFRKNTSSKETPEIIENRLKSILSDCDHNTPDNPKSIYGLLLLEIFCDAFINQDYYPITEYLTDTLSGKNVCKNTFLLDRLLSTATGIPKQVRIPYIIKNNFPSKKILSDVLTEEKINTSKSYDSIRKMLILLHFYFFWINKKLAHFDSSTNSITPFQECEY